MFWTNLYESMCGAFFGKAGPISYRRILVRSAIVCVFCFLALDAAAQVRKAPSSLRTISIITQPGGTVWIDGVLYGTASDAGELTIKTVAPGRKTIRVRADGFKETLKTLLPAQSGKISIPLAITSDQGELAFQEAERLTAVDRGKAVEAYERAVKLRPAYADAYIGLARTYAEMGEPEKAENAVARARKAKPGLAEASVVEGRIFKSSGEEDKAVASFKRALKEGGRFQPEAYAGLGLLYKDRAEGFGSSGEYDKETSNYNEAAKNLSLAIKQLSGAPDSVFIYQLLGLVYEQQKKPAAAIAVYQEFLRFFPSHPEADAFQSFIDQLKKQQNQ